MKTNRTAQNFVARSRFFTGHGIESLAVAVDFDGTLRVWDSVAGHFTSCHSLSTATAKRIIALISSKTEAEASR